MHLQIVLHIIMDQPPLTPFPSPSLSATPLPIETSSDSPTASIQNVGTSFCALRRSSSYHAEIASTVATIFDMAYLGIQTSDDSHHHTTTPHNDEINITKSDHLVVDLHPLFERVFLLGSRPRTADGHETSLRHGSFIHSNIGNHQWRLSGIHFACDGEITIYRAENTTRSLSIFIAAPTEWSTEGLQFAMSQ